MHYKQKNGFTLYNLFMDLYVTRKIKASLRLIDSLILIVFYSSLVDFYYLGPYLLNLVSSIKYICHSKEINTKIINKNFMDINTMINDLIGFFNGFTRSLCQDYNCYLGSDAIYNERCFLHLRKNNNDSILVMCREHSGSNEYTQKKSIGQIIPKNLNINKEYNNNKDNKIEIKNKKILSFMKFKKHIKKKKYLGINYNYEKNNDDIDEYYNEYINNDNNTNNQMNNITMMNMNNTTITNNLDLPSESQIFEEKEKNNEYDQVLEVFDFINNVTKRNVNEEIKYKKKISEKNNNYYDKINNNEINQIKNNNEKNNIHITGAKYNNIKNKFYSSKEDNYSNNQSSESPIHRNRTQKFNKLIASKNMELIKNINFEELNNNNYNNDMNNIKQNMNEEYSEYDNAIKESLMYNFNQINNNYVDQENTLSYEQMNNINNLNISKEIYNLKRLVRNNSVHIPGTNIYNNIIGNISNISINPYDNNNTYYPFQQNNINNSTINPYQNDNNIYYPTQNINISNNRINNNINDNNFNYNINTNSQSITPYIPGFGSNNQMQNNYYNPNQFSQNDLTFLGGYDKVGNLKEDYLKINPSNPEIISELKEKIYYYHSLSNGCKLIKISSKGYIGINIKPPNIINNKEFYINFISEKWKDHNYFTERDMNKKIEQVTEMIYKIQLQKQKNAVKLITYSLNQNISSRIKVVDTLINIYNNQFLYKFNYHKESFKFVQRIEVIIEYKNNFPGYNMIKTDGNIKNNDNTKINVIYNRSINEGKIIFPNNYNYNICNFIKKINIMIQLKNAIISNMNVKIKYSNSTNQSQEVLFCKKVSLLCFQYDL